MNVTVDFRLLLNLDCICSLREEHLRLNVLSNVYQFDALEFLSVAEQRYVQCISLSTHQDNNRALLGLVIRSHCRVFIGILDTIGENQSTNLNELLKNEWEKRLQRAIDVNLLPINEHQVEVKLDTDLSKISKRFKKIIGSLKENDVATRALTISLSIQANIPVSDLQTSM